MSTMPRHARGAVMHTIAARPMLPESTFAEILVDPCGDGASGLPFKSVAAVSRYLPVRPAGSSRR